MMDEKIALLRSRMKDVKPLDKPDDDFIDKEETLERFLKARDWNVDEAEKALRATVEYRRETKPVDMDCKFCHITPGGHSMRQVGFDESGRPVIYSSFCQASVYRNSVEDSVAHCTYLIENAKLSMKPGVSTWVWIMDCSGMTLAACNPKFGYGVSQVMSNHYPERLGLVICLNHNPVFQGVWQAIKVFLHPNTVSKMKFVRSDAKILKLFQKHFSEELTNWLLTEIKLNRQKPLSKSQVEFWVPNIQGDHDSRASPSYVKDYIEPYLELSSMEKRVHRPHPNIIDSLRGCLNEKETTKEEIEERERLLRRDNPEQTQEEIDEEESDDSFTEIEMPEC